ncbi:hypothetical protein DFH94DRAFT_711731 [Russula ochroleuca]|uniref:Secreted protein n=1 Tax=Russula ochroleuca TaxID=152965 RepID=A0A9P5N578_9AGAM|nr:hypothetical protein DFH94DRAFT_711731 [Russula ochroleuca]
MWCVLWCVIDHAPLLEAADAADTVSIRDVYRPYCLVIYFCTLRVLGCVRGISGTSSCDWHVPDTFVGTRILQQ